MIVFNTSSATSTPTVAQGTTAARVPSRRTFFDKQSLLDPQPEAQRLTFGDGFADSYEAPRASQSTQIPPLPPALSQPAGRNPSSPCPPRAAPRIPKTRKSRKPSNSTVQPKLHRVPYPPRAPSTKRHCHSVSPVPHSYSLPFPSIEQLHIARPRSTIVSPPIDTASLSVRDQFKYRIREVEARRETERLERQQAQAQEKEAHRRIESDPSQHQAQGSIQHVAAPASAPTGQNGTTPPQPIPGRNSASHPRQSKHVTTPRRPSQLSRHSAIVLEVGDPKEAEREELLDLADNGDADFVPRSKSQESLVAEEEEDDESRPTWHDSAAEESDLLESDPDDFELHRSPPPRYSHFVDAARVRSNLQRLKKRRTTAAIQSRTAWRSEEEHTFMHLMKHWPQEYNKISAFDASLKGKGHLLHRTREQLRDKARNMARTFIKYAVLSIHTDSILTMLLYRSGGPIPEGFENVIGKGTEFGKVLRKNGFKWDLKKRPQGAAANTKRREQHPPI
jgi:hypothetical protein